MISIMHLLGPNGLFDYTSFMPRRFCGDWSTSLICLHLVSDLSIWLAYLCIPIAMLRALHSSKVSYKFSKSIVWIAILYAAFITFCGWTHFFDALMFYYPVYRINGVIRLITATLSITTAVSLQYLLPKAISTPAELQRNKETVTKQFNWLKQILDIASVGKLILLSEEEITRIENLKEQKLFALVNMNQLFQLRKLVETSAQEAGIGLAESFEIMSAVHELAMNTLTHANGSAIHILKENNKFIVRISDAGAGIPLDKLPLATLKPGYSTKDTMGQGWIIAIQFSDRIYLKTDESGTTVILEKNIKC